MRASSPGRSGGGRERKESLQPRLWNLNSTSNSLWLPVELSDFRKSARSGNESECKINIEKHVKARAKGNDVITNVISTNQHFA